MDPVVYLYVLLVVALIVLLTWDRILGPFLEDIGVLRPADSDETVSTYASAEARDYDELRPAPRAAASLPSRPVGEVKREVKREVSGEVEPGLLHISEKALREQGRDAYEQGAIDVYATLLKLGYLDEAVRARQLGGLKQAIHKLTFRHTGIFGATGGKTLQRFNELVDAVPLELDSELPRRTPIAGRELAPDARFIDDDELAAAH
jgi:hypothetical protein